MVLSLVDSQLAAVEKVKNRREATGEIELCLLNIFSSQDIYYAWNIKGIGTHLPTDLCRHLLY